MDKKDKIELCLKQAELGASRWDRRRNDEWKVTLLFWGGLLASAKFIREANVSVPLIFLIVGGISFIAIYTFIWLRGLWRANYNDKNWEFFYRAEAARLLSTDSEDVLPAPEKANPPISQFLSNYSMLFQIVMTALITLAAIMIIGGKPNAKGNIHTQDPNTVVTITDTADANSK